MARRRKGRNISGVILLDKPQGLSSNDALQKVKRLFGAAKAGHTGALDPLATGMLPICLGEATKFSQFLLDSDKGYRVIAQLGVRTDSSDSTGEVVETRPVKVTRKQLEAALDHFRGDILQVPTMFSALKHNGQPLYKYAREGITIEREARPITIYSLQLINFNNDQVELDIECSKGTYIRTIIDDLGQMLDCGAHVIFLRRNYVADYPLDAMVTLEQLQNEREQNLSLDPHLLPVESPVSHLDQVVIDQDSQFYFNNGNPITYPGLDEGELLRVYDQDDLFLGVAEVNEDFMLAPKRLVVYE